MSVLNKNIIRGVLIASYVLLIALILFGVSALYSYLNTGADRSSMLHTKIDAKEHYTPKVTWKPINNEGRPIDKETLKNIESDYLDAWYVRHVAYKTNLKEGISDYYTANALENLFNIIDLNTSGNTSITSTTLEHHPTLAFFSEDGQLAVLKDKNVVEYKRIYKADNLRLILDLFLHLPCTKLISKTQGVCSREAECIDNKYHYCRRALNLFLKTPARDNLRRDIRLCFPFRVLQIDRCLKLLDVF